MLVTVQGFFEGGDMTADLARIAEPAASAALDSWQFIGRIAERL
jgi:hypothetical protein